ncbi:MAG: alanine--tRNA ligase [Candidatus Saganbacteria bacterium]|nr:alanine--tRNA ligase [Candidatus Saganbacteria bacterium]
MKGQEIRKRFLKFFEDKGHKILPSSSLVPADPTVLLTLAGMLQFKPYFLGIEVPSHKRVATSQKCVRMVDIERVGKTSQHHTFFEMLGNFSFGDYFKGEAISFAFELLTKEFKVPLEKLLFAVYEKDDEAYGIWKNTIGIPEDRIFRLSEENNFWAAGPTGPCGPCSEIYYDRGGEKGCGKPDCKPGCDCARYLEIWNLVFIEFDRDESGKLIPLPSKNIDTGMGLERIASILQDVPTNFDTDLFTPITAAIHDAIPEDIEKKREYINVIADHIRAITYLISDGVIPSNEGRGYVLRRLIRRASRFASLLGIKDSFLSRLSKTVVELGGDIYPELKKKENEIQKIIKIEETNFSSTLDQGLKLLQNLIEEHKDIKMIPGRDVFVLHDTYGFPIELTKELAGEKGFKIDEKGFTDEMEKQREKARCAGISGKKLDLQKLILSKFGATKFLGYETLQSDAKVVAVLPEEELIILDRTPFYPEGGGQTGDVGNLQTDGTEVKVKATSGAIGKAIAHQVDDVRPFKNGMAVKATVDSGTRYQTANHHTATHLLHAALRAVLGEGAKQTGSFVCPTYLRFDFSHFEPLTDDELLEIEKIVNDRIKQNIKVEVEEMPIRDAEKLGAVALFGEKYGAKVRVVKTGDVSMELCAGTHVKSTGIIELFKIKKEEAVASGVRRIEAVAGSPVIDYVLLELEKYRKQNIELLSKLKKLEYKKQEIGGSPLVDFDIFEITLEEQTIVKKALWAKDMIGIEKFLDHLNERNGRLEDRIVNIEKEIKKRLFLKASENIGKLSQEAKDISGIKVVARELVEEYPKDILREIADGIRDALKSCVVALACSEGGKVFLVTAVTDDLIKKGLDAGSLIKTAAKILGGGGGGKPGIAEAGGNNKGKIKEALEAIVAGISDKLGAK